MAFSFYVSKDVLDLGVKILGVEIDGLDNATISEGYLKYRKESVNKLVQLYEDVKPKEDPIIEGFYQLHDKVHVKRRKNVPASETLIRLLQKRKDLPHINKVVDLYNIVSARSKLALGAHDIDKIDGNVHLKLQTGKESFVPLGQNEEQEIKAGEYSYIDDADDIICHLEIRQVNKTLVDEHTKRIFLIVQGNEATSDDLLEQTAQSLIDLITEYCGGKGKILPRIYDKIEA